MLINFLSIPANTLSSNNGFVYVMKRYAKLAAVFFSGLLLIFISPYVLMIAGMPMVYISNVYWKRVVTSQEDTVVCGCDTSGGTQISRNLPESGAVNETTGSDEEYNISMLLALTGISWILIGFAYLSLSG